MGFFLIPILATFGFVANKIITSKDERKAISTLLGSGSGSNSAAALGSGAASALGSGDAVTINVIGKVLQFGSSMIEWGNEHNQKNVRAKINTDYYKGYIVTNENAFDAIERLAISEGIKEYDTFANIKLLNINISFLYVVWYPR